MSRNRYKDGEILDARIKLDDVLQTLIKPKDNQNTDNDTMQKDEIDIEYPNSPILNPTIKTSPKGSGRYSRKRKMREELSDHESQSSQPAAGSMKLFDRTVNFLQFDTDPSLYSLCRAWVRNLSTIDYSKQIPFPEMNEEDLVYHLPPPIKLEEGEAHPIVPTPLPRHRLKIEDINSENNSNCKDLLAIHIKRWKSIREMWKKALLTNENRYAQSYTILSDMYDKLEFAIE